MSIIGTLTQKPWLETGAETGSGGASLRDQDPAAVALTFYICIITALFLIMVVTYVLRMGDFSAGAEWTDGAAPAWSLLALCGIPPARDWLPMPEPGLLWVNTAMLMASSVAWQFARWRADQGAYEGPGVMPDGLRFWVLAGAGLGIVFVIGQLSVWRELSQAGYYLQSNPANAFFYVLTALHGLHMLGGIIVAVRTLLRVAGGADAVKVRTGIDLNATYWHYLLIVWIVMFVLLLMT